MALVNQFFMKSQSQLTHYCYCAVYGQFYISQFTDRLLLMINNGILEKKKSNNTKKTVGFYLTY